MQGLFSQNCNRLKRLEKFWDRHLERESLGRDDRIKFLLDQTGEWTPFQMIDALASVAAISIMYSCDDIKMARKMARLFRDQILSEITDHWRAVALDKAFQEGGLMQKGAA